MTALIHKRSIPDLADFVHPVAKLIAAVFNVNVSLSKWKISSIHVCDARHLRKAGLAVPLVDPERFQLAVQGRTLHPHELRGA